MAGTTAAVDFLAGMTSASGSRRDRLRVAMTAVEEHEDRLRARIEETLAGLPGCTVHSRARRRTPTLLVTFAGHDMTDVERFLAARGVNAPAHSFYAYEPSRRLGLGEAGGLRIGLAPYNDDADVDRLSEGLRAYFGG
jgi:selenocysteine lyase/cysteine desulfurase